MDTYTDEVSGIEHWKVAAPEDLFSPVWLLWQSGTRFEWAWPCQGCEEYFVPRLKLLVGWDPGDSPSVCRRKARVTCPRCGYMHEEKDKQAMNDGGCYVAPGQRVVRGVVLGDAPESRWATFWVSGLCSPWVSFGDRAYAWVAAARTHDQETIRTTINTGFGELFALKGEAPPWEDVRSISDNGLYELEIVPRGVRMIFLTIDIQKDHLVCVIRGWGVEMESWLLHREEIWGETDKTEVYERLDVLADKDFDGHAINAYAMDTGYRTERAYDWCEKRLGRAYATKGREAPRKLYSMNDIEVLRSGKKVKRGLKLTSFDHGYMKGWVHDRVRWPQDAPGAWHLPKAVGEDYCRQLVAEQRMRLASGKTQWVKRGVNDYLDCEALQVLLAHLQGVRLLKPDDQPPPAPRGRGTRTTGVKV